MESDKTMDRLIAVSEETGLSLDVLAHLAEGLDARSIAILCDNASALFRKSQSSDSPNISYIFRAP